MGQATEPDTHDMQIGTATEPQSPAALLHAWEQAYRQDFEKDSGAVFATILQRFGLDVDAPAMLEGTIEFVRATAALRELDNLDVVAFLAEQRYAPQCTATTYSLVFDVCQHGAACLLTTPDLKFIDLADLYGWPWERLELVGYSSFWVYRIDGQALDAAEIEALDQQVSNDIAFDYGDDEVSVDFDPDSFEGALTVTICDHPDE
jgi:hypothetical protein